MIDVHWRYERSTSEEIGGPDPPEEEACKPRDEEAPAPCGLSASLLMRRLLPPAGCRGSLQAS
jgi:hypothetical protein